MKKEFLFHEIVYAFLSPFPIPPSHLCRLTHGLPGLLAYWSYYYCYLLSECQLGRPVAERKVHYAQNLIVENKVVEVGIKVTLRFMLFLGRGWRQHVLMELAGNFHCRVFVFLREKACCTLSGFFFFSKQESRFQKDTALFSSRNTVLFLDENWLHEPDRKSATTARSV